LKRWLFLPPVAVLIALGATVGVGFVVHPNLGGLFQGLGWYIAVFPGVFIAASVFVVSLRASRAEMQAFYSFRLTAFLGLAGLFCATALEEIALPMIAASAVVRDCPVLPPAEAGTEALSGELAASPETAWVEEDAFPGAFPADSPAPLTGAEEKGVATLEATPGATPEATLEATPEDDLFEIDGYTRAGSGVPPSGEALQSLMNLAERCYQAVLWFQAHYYAEQALFTLAEGPEKQRMAFLSNAAWERLAQPEQFIDGEARQLFRQKRSGYIALAEGNYLLAYRIYSRLLFTNDEDNDVGFFYHQVLDELRQHYYFMDDMEAALAEKGLGDITFSLPRPEGGIMEVHFDGAAILGGTGATVILVRGLELRFVDDQGNEEGRITAPFCEIIPAAPGKLAPAVRETQGIRQTQDVPLLLLEGIDPSRGVVVAAAAYGGERGRRYEGSNSVYLDMPLEDLPLIFDAAVAPERMNVLALLEFEPKAGHYGFPSTLVTRCLSRLLGYPLVFIILFFMFTLLGKHCSIDDPTAFQPSWFLALPVLFIVVHALFQLALVYNHILATALSALIPGNALVALLGIFLFLLLLTVTAHLKPMK
jgi:hypothetical protein